jgi:uncharacterized membrane protein (UPF0127 family)
MKSIYKGCGLLILISTLLSCSGEKEQTQSPRNRTLTFTETVTFLTSDKEPITSIDVAIADSEQETQLGLMFVNELSDHQGMLFVFNQSTPRSFWMANTPLPLDIIFVNSDFEIVRIHRNTPPYSRESFSSDDPAQYVVEVIGGFTVKHDIQEGMFIQRN